MNEPPLLGIDLNELPVDEERVIQLHECPNEIDGQVHFHEYIELTDFGKRKDDPGENNFVPFIGQCFLSEEEAFIFYKNHAFANGFSVRKNRSEKRKGEVNRRDFCCQCEGKASTKLCDPSKQQRNRNSVRCGCKARMRITLRKSLDIFPQKWQVTEFVKEHNHETLTPSEVRFLPANRIIVKEDEDRILLSTMNEPPLLSIDLDELPVDEERVIQLHEYPNEINGQVHFHEYIELADFGQRKDDPGENNFVPFIGQCFLSEEEAFIFYKNHAFANGFSVRKSRSEKRKGEVKRQDFCCQCEGKVPIKLCDPSKQQRNRNSVRCGCKARMRITLRKSLDIFPQEWQVTEFVKEHNHEVLTPSVVRFLPANRIIVKEDEDRILLLQEGGLSIRQIMRVMELEKGIDHGYLPFFEKDVRNLFTRIRKKHVANDAENIEPTTTDSRRKKKITSSDMGLNPAFSLKY